MSRQPPPFNAPQAQASPLPQHPQISPRAAHLPPFRRYPALEVVRFALLVLAALAVLGWIGTTAMMVRTIYDVIWMAPDWKSLFSFANDAIWTLLFSSLVSFVGTSFVVCALIAMRELISVAIHIQENTLAAARR